MFKTIKSDLPASIVVFFVALPLCLGIALASGAPLFSGLIAGIVGGIVVGAISGSNIGVSGPAAGLAAIVLTAIGSLGGYQNFLVAVVLAGIIQIILGFLKAGIIGYYFPSSVIKGMLTGIGIIIILKQIPHFFGYDAEPEGADSFIEASGENTFSAIFHVADNISLGATLIGILGLLVILFWDNILAKKGKFFKILQGPLVAVVLGIVYFILTQSHESLSIDSSHLVSVPIPDDLNSFLGQFSFPNFSAITNSEVWLVGFTMALVASLETLLCVEATDKLDPDKNVTPTNRELLAQGTGNIISGLIGGLPITQVIVRSSANIQSGGKSKLSAIIHGFLLLISVILIPRLLNKIPLSVLAAILLVVGYKLAKPSLFKKMVKMGWKQYVPFFVTVVGIVFTDLLVGISLGLGVGIIIILIKSYQNSHFLHIEDRSNDRHKIKMTLAEEVTFFNKGAILKELENLPKDTYLELDLINTRYLDQDIIEILEDFLYKAKERRIDIKLVSKRGVVENPESFVEFFKTRPKSSKSLS
ncbi:SulP family inorganic anion transporter [Mangrovimonas futianensis]|uniref:SulP family inorganic anion transporter n=1 Tax=Mangrovimonas futianensis TaxID=2895523 RepID=UPI001E4EF6A3|nr:SulP family inorganic anion transporter [Mangrovimonas futianensis]MCF1420744.1 SulP family inorganic anion transporter [Mangrovimonas futianensis]